MQLRHLQLVHKLCLLQKASFLTTPPFPSWLSFLTYFCALSFSFCPSFHKQSGNIHVQNAAEMWQGDKDKDLEGVVSIFRWPWDTRTHASFIHNKFAFRPYPVLSTMPSAEYTAPGTTKTNKHRTNPQLQGLYNREAVLNNLLEDELWSLMDLTWILNPAYSCVNLGP